MILDRGICTVFREVNMAANGDMPRKGYDRYYQSWFGELSFETSPARPTEGRQELRTDARIRVHQNRAIRQNDVVILANVSTFDDRDPADEVYRINRAWHGQDDDGPTPVTDLSLEVINP